MNMYTRPIVEFVEFDSDDILITSACPGDYACPNMYGQGCAGHCYEDVCDDSTCGDDFCYSE